MANVPLKQAHDSLNNGLNLLQLSLNVKHSRFFVLCLCYYNFFHELFDSALQLSMCLCVLECVCVCACVWVPVKYFKAHCS